MGDEQKCVMCTWDGYKVVKLCAHHQQIGELHQQLAERTLQHKTQLDNAVRLTNENELLTKQLAEARAALLAVDNALEFWKVEHPSKVLCRIQAAREIAAAAGGV